MLTRYLSNIVVLITIVTLSVSEFAAVSYAKPSKHRKKQATRIKENEALASDIRRSKQYAAIVLNADNGNILFQANAHSHRHPASLAKMMTVYLTFEALKNQKLGLNTPLKTSNKAERALPSKLGLKAGDTITVRQAILALIVKSANDAAVTIAENIAGSEWQFAQRMNAKARKLKMYNTVFKNASGWHNPRQVSTAYDLALLSMALRRDFPEYYHLFSKTEFTFKGETIKGHNRVLERYAYADGLKTGFINASGFNLATSASNDRGRIVAIVMGGQSAKIRDDHMINLLERSYAKVQSSNQIAKNTHQHSTPFNVLNSPSRHKERHYVW